MTPGHHLVSPDFHLVFSLESGIFLFLQKHMKLKPLLDGMMFLEMSLLLKQDLFITELINASSLKAPRISLTFP